MRVRCTSVSLPQDLEPPRFAKFPGTWPVTLNAEYSVIALSQQDGLWWVTVEHHEREMPVSAPLALFEVVDAAVPPSWTVHVKGDEVSLQPEELDDEFFCDDVQERRDGALERYRAMKARLDRK